MAFTLEDYFQQSQALAIAGLQNSLKSNEDALALSNQATDDAIWRMAQNNAMAKMKGLNKLAETANQMAN